MAVKISKLVFCSIYRVYIVNRFMLTTNVCMSSKKKFHTIHSTYLMFSYLLLELNFIWNARVYILRRLVLIILSYFLCLLGPRFLTASVRYIPFIQYAKHSIMFKIFQCVLKIKPIAKINLIFSF